MCSSLADAETCEQQDHIGVVQKTSRRGMVGCRPMDGPLERSMSCKFRGTGRVVGRVAR